MFALLLTAEISPLYLVKKVLPKPTLVIFGLAHPLENYKKSIVAQTQLFWFKIYQHKGLKYTYSEVTAL